MHNRGARPVNGSHHVSGGRHSLQIPGPTNVPERVLRAMAKPTIDHRGPEFAAFASTLLEELRPVFGTTGPVVIFPASGTGALEAALVNTLSPGDRVVCFETGFFSTCWRDTAAAFGLQVTSLVTDWRHGADPDALAAELGDDPEHQIKAVLVVHSETSTGILSRVAELRRVLDQAGHPALLMVDGISSVASVDYRHDEWGIDVTITGSQKGLMLPPGLSFSAISERALRAATTARLPKWYWNWEPMLTTNQRGFFPYTPATNMLYGLDEALRMLYEEGLPAVFARHERHARATRRAVAAWGLEVQCLDEREHSPIVTAVVVPEGHDADAVRAVILETYDMALGTGLGKLAGRVFRIGHLGHFNDVSLIGVLGGVELGLARAGVPITREGVAAALSSLEPLE